MTKPVDDITARLARAATVWREPETLRSVLVDAIAEIDRLRGAIEPDARCPECGSDTGGHKLICPQVRGVEPTTLPDFTAGLIGQGFTPELEAEFKRRVEAAGYVYGGIFKPGDSL